MAWTVFTGSAGVTEGRNPVTREVERNVNCFFQNERNYSRKEIVQ